MHENKIIQLSLKGKEKKTIGLQSTKSHNIITSDGCISSEFQLKFESSIEKGNVGFERVE